MKDKDNVSFAQKTSKEKRRNGLYLSPIMTRKSIPAILGQRQREHGRARPRAENRHHIGCRKGSKAETQYKLLPLTDGSWQ